MFNMFVYVWNEVVWQNRDYDKGIVRLSVMQ